MVDEKRMRWRCRRGMKELDAMLCRFLAEGFPSLGAPEKEVFERLLEENDADLCAWLLGCAKPPRPDYLRLVQRIRFAVERPPSRQAGNGAGSG